MENGTDEKLIEKNTDGEEFEEYGDEESPREVVLPGV
jgi:hypothetical protein